MAPSDPILPLPQIGEGLRGIDAHAGYLLRQAAGALRGAMDKVLEPAGMTNPQFAVLAMLDIYPGGSGADLARLSQLTPQTLTVITRNLVGSGLIRRGFAVRGHRQIPYELTEMGHTVLSSGKQVADQVEGGGAKRIFVY